MKREARTVPQSSDPEKADFFPPGTEPFLSLSVTPSGVVILLIEEEIAATIPRVSVDAAVAIARQYFEGVPAVVHTAAHGFAVKDLGVDIACVAPACSRAAASMIAGDLEGAGRLGAQIKPVLRQ